MDASPVPQKEVLVNQKRKPDECDVVVTINWAKRQKKKVLPPQLSFLGKMLCRGTKKQIAKAAWKYPTTSLRRNCKRDSQRMRLHVY